MCLIVCRRLACSVVQAVGTAIAESTDCDPRYGSPLSDVSSNPDCDGDYEPGNIRFDSNTIQARNMRVKKNNTSGYTGVSKSKGGKFISTVGINYKVITIGRFKSPIEAAIARDLYILKHNLRGFKVQVL